MAPRNSELRRPSYSELELGAQSLPSPELQALLSLYNSDACWRQGPTLARSKVKNFERPQMAPASAVCGELVFPPQRIKIYLTATCKFSGQRRVLAGYTCVSKCHEKHLEKVVIECPRILWHSWHLWQPRRNDVF